MGGGRLELKLNQSIGSIPWFSFLEKRGECRPTGPRSITLLILNWLVLLQTASTVCQRYMKCNGISVVFQSVELDVLSQSERASKPIRSAWRKVNDHSQVLISFFKSESQTRWKGDDYDAWVGRRQRRQWWKRKRQQLQRLHQQQELDSTLMMTGCLLFSFITSHRCKDSGKTVKVVHFHTGNYTIIFTVSLLRQKPSI